MELAELVNQLFNGHNIRHTMDVENPLWVAADIGQLLGIKNISDSVVNFSPKEKRIATTRTNRGNRDMLLLTEGGLYRLLYNSRLPVAEIFREWVTEIIKNIRLNGSYSIKKQQPEIDFKLLEQRILNLENENKKKDKVINHLTKENRRWRQLSGGVKKEIVYVFQTTQTDEGIYKIGHTSDYKKRESAANTYVVGGVTPVYVVECSARPGSGKACETQIHFLLDDYRMVYDREFFECELELIKQVCDYVCAGMNQGFDLIHNYKPNKNEKYYLTESPTRRLSYEPARDFTSYDTSSLQYDSESTTINEFADVLDELPDIHETMTQSTESTVITSAVPVLLDLSKFETARLQETPALTPSKKCKECAVVKPMEDYRVQKKSKDGRGNTCKLCTNNKKKSK